MKTLWTETLPATDREPALRVDLVSQGDDPAGPCVVRTSGARGLQGPSYYRADLDSGLVKAAAVLVALKAKRGQG